MLQATENAADVERQRTEWVARITALVEQVAGWAAAEGWAVDRRTETITERRLGTYDAPALTVHPPEGEVSLTPVALDLFGHQHGRVDLSAIPTMSRIKLLGQPDGGWEMVAGSNIRLRRPWTRRKFVELVSDLLS
jgi:hypothetical protein